MPTKPRTRCPRCKQLHDGLGTCASCKAKADPRPNRHARGYGYKHQGFRAKVLARDPICVMCGRMPSTVADHWPMSRRELVALGLDPNDPAYGRGLCITCNNIQTHARQPRGPFKR